MIWHEYNLLVSNPSQKRDSHSKDGRIMLTAKQYPYLQLHWPVEAVWEDRIIE